MLPDATILPHPNEVIDMSRLSIRKPLATNFLPRNKRIALALEGTVPIPAAEDLTKRLGIPLADAKKYVERIKEAVQLECTQIALAKDLPGQTEEELAKRLKAADGIRERFESYRFAFEWSERVNRDGRLDAQLVVDVYMDDDKYESLEKLEEDYAELDDAAKALLKGGYKAVPRNASDHVDTKLRKLVVQKKGEGEEAVTTAVVIPAFFITYRHPDGTCSRGFPNAKPDGVRRIKLPVRKLQEMLTAEGRIRSTKGGKFSPKKHFQGFNFVSRDMEVDGTMRKLQTPREFAVWVEPKDVRFDNTGQFALIPENHEAMVLLFEEGVIDLLMHAYENEEPRERRNMLESHGLELPHSGSDEDEDDESVLTADVSKADFTRKEKTGGRRRNRRGGKNRGEDKPNGASESPSGETAAAATPATEPATN